VQAATGILGQERMPKVSPAAHVCGDLGLMANACASAQSDFSRSLWGIWRSKHPNFEAIRRKKSDLTCTNASVGAGGIEPPTSAL
jgi:hypothetical protein